MMPADNTPLGITGQTLDFALKVLQFGALGLGALVIVLSFLIILVRTTIGGPLVDSQRKSLNSFMVLGGFAMIVSFGCLLGEKYIPSRAKVSVAFSPSFEIIGAPVPLIKYGEDSYAENHAFLVQDDGTIIITADATLNYYRNVVTARDVAVQQADKATQVLQATDNKIGSTIKIISDQQKAIQSIAGAVSKDTVATLPASVPANFEAVAKSSTSTIEQLGSIREELKKF